MSTIDQAFIRAYEFGDRPGPSTAASPGAPRGVPSTFEAEPPASANRPAASPTRLDQSPAQQIAAPHFGAVSAGRAAATADRERRPLSTFAAPARSVESQFRPSLEVDQFRWSEPCQRLFALGAPTWQFVLQAIAAANDAGKSLLGVAAATRGAGATTILCTVARLLAQAGKSVAVVDADFRTAGLARQLGLAVQIGWEDVLGGRVPLAEAVVQSLGDGLALLPLVHGGVPDAEKLDAIHASVTAGVLRYHYDMVLFDLGAATDPVQGPVARRIARQCRLDATLFVAGGDWPALPVALSKSAPELAAACIGVIENELAAA